jgi:hypothetical protein
VLDFYGHLCVCHSSQVKFSVEVPPSIIHDCYQTTLQEYAKRFKVYIISVQTATMHEYTHIKFLNTLVPLLHEVDYDANVYRYTARH